MSFGLARFLSELSGLQRLLAFALVAVSVSMLLAYLSGGLPVMALALFGINGVLWITRPVWLSPDHGRTRLRLFSLSVVLGVATLLAAGPTLAPLLAAFVEQQLHGSVPDWVNRALAIDRLIAIALMVFVLSAVFLVNWLARDRSTMKEHPTPLDAEFPERGYRKRRNDFCEVLRSHLRDLNLKTRWSEAHFTPLEAEVEVLAQGRAKRQITDLMTALRSDHRSRVFLVLGDPGSGKSVALRTLAMRLLDEVEWTGRVPIYVNLKEWETETPWSEERPPSVAELQAFILRNLKERSDVFGEEFLDLYFKRMLENGRFFVLLDSFDEIPGVLDVPENSWLIERLSQVISTFLAGATETRGVVSSRLFRRPTLSLDDGATLEIRPFDETRIARTLKNSEYVDDLLVQRLFRERPELVPIARNPFTAALIQAYASQTHGRLPNTQLELYESYIGARLRAAGERLEKSGLTQQEVIDTCIEIAWTQFDDPGLGLEAPLARLESALLAHPVREVVKLLSFARLMRLGGADEERASFVHRRFNEYFVAQSLIRHPERVVLHSIPSDSQWRDALVLYCEVSDTARATAIADFCWNEARVLAQATVFPGDPAFLRAVHSLRFLRDAFRARPECLAGFRDELDQLLEDEVGFRHGPLSAKIALEATGLVKSDRVESIVATALDKRDPWLSDAALRACRHLPRLNDDIEEKLRAHINSLPLRTLLARHQELLFSLGLSDAFSSLRRFVLLKRLDVYLLSIALITWSLVSPLGVLFSLAAIALNLLLWLLLIYQMELVRKNLPALKAVRQMRTLKLLSDLEQVTTDIALQVSKPTFILRGALLLTATIYFAGLLDLQHVARIEGFSQILHYIYLAPIMPCQELLAVELCGKIVPIMTAFAVTVLAPPSLFVTFSGLWKRVSSFLRWRRFLKTIPQVLASFVVAGAALIIVWSLLPLTIFVPRRLLELLAMVLVVIFVSGSLTILAAAISYLYRFLRDRRLLKSFSQLHPLDRTRIESELASLSTRRARLRYVERLSEFRTKPAGAWTHGLPYRAQDPASTLLAQLEERWLGLADR